MYLDQERTGKRLLMALISPQSGDEQEDGSSALTGDFSVHSMLLAIGSVCTLVLVIAMCACKNGDSKDKAPHTNGKNNADITDEINGVTKSEASPQIGESVENGVASTSNRNSANMSKHSRQASSASGSNIRPASTNLRELPEPPVDSHHHPHPQHSRNTSSSGMVVLPPPPPPSSSSSATAATGGSSNGSSGNKKSEDLGKNDGPLNLASSQHGDPDSSTYGYDHFGPKTLETPPGYDQLGNVKIGRITDDKGLEKSSSSEMGDRDVDLEGVEEVRGHFSPRHHHYSQPKERTYDVVKDVKRESSKLYHADSFTQVKEEDPYNQIGESDNTVSNAMIKRIRQSMDADDLYATIQGDSDGSYALVDAQRAASSAPKQPPTPSIIGMMGASNSNPTSSVNHSSHQEIGNCDAQGAVGGVAAKSSDAPSYIPPTTSSSPSSSTPPGGEDEEDLEEEVEYAVVNKPTTETATHARRSTHQHHQQSSNKKSVGNVNDEDGSSSISPYNTYRPPEPPRKYGHYAEVGAVGGHIGHNNGDDEDDDWYEDGDLKSSGAKEHTYSKVSARESLASMSARHALNPYETVPDIPENMYATVEGGSGDGVIPAVTMRNRLDRTNTEENRLSQNSDTYAEIGISGGGLTTSVISNTSTTSSTNNSNNNHNSSTTILGTSSGSSAGGAPIPPSLDSLHQMTKSQTSSEGDRLSDRMSDRYLGSPDDWIMPGQFEGIGGGGGGSQLTHHHYHRADGSDEESYRTLTRTSGSVVDSSNNYDNNSGNSNLLRSSMINGNGRHQGLTITDVESGEVTPIPSGNNNYETVEDGIGGADGSGRRFVFRGGREGVGGGEGTGRERRLILLDSEENDPNYESVDETRAKVALLKARESEAVGIGAGPAASMSSPPLSPMYATPHEFRQFTAQSPKSSSGGGAVSPSSMISSPPPPAPHVSVVNLFKKGGEKDEKQKHNGANFNSTSVSSTSSASSSPPVAIDRSQPRRRRPNHDYEEVDLSPPLSPLRSHTPLSTSAPPMESAVDPDVRERVLNSHTYEELPQVKLSKKDEKRKSDRAKKQHSSLSSSEEKKKSKEEKKKSKMEEKKKAAAASSAGSGNAEGGSSAGASWDGSKKSDSWETNRTRL